MSSNKMDTLNLQVKLENEKDIYDSEYKLPGSPDNLPYRKIWDVAFYNNKVFASFLILMFYNYFEKLG
jgi:hypothetical protein